MIAFAHLHKFRHMLSSTFQELSLTIVNLDRESIIIKDNLISMRQTRPVYSAKTTVSLPLDKFLETLCLLYLFTTFFLHLSVDF